MQIIVQPPGALGTWRAVALVALVLLPLGCFADVHAGDTDPAATPVGVIRKMANESLAQGDYEVAYYRFKDILVKEPDGRDDLLALGKSAVATGRFAEAQAALQRVLDRGDDTPDVHYLMARALFGQKAYPEAMLALDRADDHSPHALQLRGVILYEQGRLEEAVRAFEQLRAADPDNAAAPLYLGSIAAVAGDRTRAMQHWEQAIQLAGPGSYVHQRAQSLLKYPDTEEGAAEPGWTHRWGMSTGYDSNVISIGSGQALPSDISGRDAFFADAHASGLWTGKPSSPGGYRAGYAVSARVYEGLSDYNLESLGLFGQWSKPWGRDGKSVDATLAWDEYFLGERHYLRSLRLAPGIDVSRRDDSALRAFYSLVYQDYTGDVPTPQLDRTGVTNDIGLAAWWRPGSGRWTATAAYRHSFINTKGADYDAEADGVHLAAQARISPRHSVELAFGWLWYDYSNPNSRTGFAVARSDEVAYISATAYLASPRAKTRPRLSVYHMNNGSNIALFDYHRTVITMGFDSRF